jgi:hypothetical protein
VKRLDPSLDIDIHALITSGKFSGTERIRSHPLNILGSNGPREYRPKIVLS